MYSIVQDESKFRKLNLRSDPTEQTEKQINGLLKSMRDQNIIQSNLHDQLHSCGTTAPRLYGLPKIHKTGIPMRPILDMINSPFHSTAKWLAQLLKPILQQLTTYTLKDSFQLAERLKDVSLIGKKMLSLDVNSLFTNVPLLETVDYICKVIKDKQFEIGIPILSLKQLLLRCTMNAQFLFNGDYYRQIDGVAMGSPLGPILADFFMTKLEHDSLKSTLSTFDYYFRYVDDTLIICDMKTDIEEIIDSFNKAHEAISFIVRIGSKRFYSLFGHLVKQTTRWDYTT